MNQIERIQYYEELLIESKAVLKQYEEAFDSFVKIQKQIGELGRYYGNDEWEQDFEASKNGILPGDLNCEVLTESGIDDMIGHSLQLVFKTKDFENLVRQYLKS